MSEITYYKFVAKKEHALDIIRNLRLKVTPPNQFNDPFEFSPRPTGSLTRRVVKQRLNDKNAQRELFEEYKRGGGGGSFKEFRGVLREERDIEKAQRISTTVVKEKVKDTLNFISAKVGVICFSKCNNHILLWSHYAYKHTGFAFGFDGTREPFIHMSDVRYARGRTECQLERLGNSSYDKEFRYQVIGTKAECWNYEEEVRAVVPINMCEPVQNKGEKKLFLKISENTFKEVIFGCRCTKSDRSEIAQAIKHAKLNVVFREATMHESEFALAIAPVLHSA